MKIVSKSFFLKDMNYGKQLFSYYIFMIAAVAMGIPSLFYFGFEDLAGIIAALVIVFCIIIPFGYFLGLKGIIRTNARIRKIKNNRIRIIERRVTDKTRRPADDMDRYCQLVFGEDNGFWVSRSLDKKIKVGDVCYLIYLEGDDEPSGIYNKRLYRLDTELEQFNQGIQE